MSETELIDWEQLEMIFGEEEEEFDEDMAELFHEFVEDGNGQFQLINSAEFDSERAVIAKESHKLKGSASNFGFARVACILGQIEDGIASLTKEDFVRNISEARIGFDKSVETIVARYPGLSDGLN